jgi:hypothetical protein
MAYADDMERWVVALDREAEEDQVLRLAARCQHLNRVRLLALLVYGGSSYCSASGGRETREGEKLICTFELFIR